MPEIKEKKSMADLSRMLAERVRRIENEAGQVAEVLEKLTAISERKIAAAAANGATEHQP